MKDFVFAEYDLPGFRSAAEDALRPDEDRPWACPFNERPDAPPPREPLEDRLDPELLEWPLP